MVVFALLGGGASAKTSVLRGLHPLSSARGSAVAPRRSPSPTASHPLKDALTPSGRLRAGAQGSFNAKGYRMVLGKNGAPRFVKAPTDAGKTVAVSAPTVAADKYWSDAFGVVGAPDAGTINAVAVSGSNIYIGGQFSDVSSDAALSMNNVAMYNGHGWYPLGSATSNGVNGAVDALAVSGSDVYVGGSFNSASGTGANAIAMWNGTKWSALGSGMSDPVSGNTPTVSALAVSGETLYAAGTFDDAGGATANSIAAWNGTAWSPLGSGIQECIFFNPAPDCYPPDEAAGQVNAIAVSGSTVYVGGAFNQAGGATIAGLAKWNGSAWSAVGGSVLNGSSTGSVTSIALNGSTLYVGGNFDHVGGSYDGNSVSGGVAAASVAEWNGTAWSALGGGTTYCCGSATVSTVAYWNGRLYIAGNFSGAGGDGQANTAVWNGTTWAPVGPNLDSPPSRLLATSGGVIAAGGFGGTADSSVHLNDLALWNGTAWSGYGLGITFGDWNAGGVQTVAASNNTLYAGGDFYFAGQSPAQNLAVFNGTTWHSVGAFTGAPYAILISGRDVYVAGSFSQAGTVAASNIAMWDGSQWHALTDAAGSNGTNGTVSALAMDGGTLWVGGSFSQAGSVGASDVATWNPATSTWAAVGGNLQYDNGSVSALTVLPSPYNDYVAIGGQFGSVSSGATTYTVNSLLLFKTTATDNTGYSWPTTASGTPGVWTPGSYGGQDAGTIHALVADGTKLYMGGSFADSGAGSDNGFTAWDYSTGAWSNPGAVGGGSAGGSVNTIVQVGTQLYIGGDFTTAGTVSSPDVAEFSPGTGTATGTWSALGSGMAFGTTWGGQPAVTSLAQSAAGLYAGGSFSLAGGKASENIALWTQTAFPIKVAETVSAASVTADSPVTFTAKVTDGAARTQSSVVLRDGLPANAIFESATPSQGSCTRSGQALSCSLGSIAGGASATVAVKLEPIMPGSSSNLATVSQTGSSYSNTTSAAVSVNPQAMHGYLGVSDSGFSSSTLLIRQGSTVQFDFFGPAAHSVVDPITGCSTGSKSPISLATCAYTTSGDFIVKEDNATTHEATIEVPDVLSAATVAHGTSVTVTGASAAVKSGWGIDYQVLKPGTTTWLAFSAGSTSTSAAYKPATAGTYQFRSRLRNLTSGAISAYSVPVKLNAT